MPFDDRHAGFTLSLHESRTVAIQINLNANPEYQSKDATALLELAIDDGPTVSFPRGAASMSIDEGPSA